ncbi:hypothetical protein F5Y19DRAFT_190965 [Xylariaceae sp. FL1651]|nr:hypothetical protein F5Y19DRAFT_190965 [Xylariaceae sp. FL1651]
MRFFCHFLPQSFFISLQPGVVVVAVAVVPIPSLSPSAPILVSCVTGKLNRRRLSPAPLDGRIAPDYCLSRDDDYEHYFGPLDDSAVQDFINNGGVQANYRFSPPPSPPNDDSFFATIGDSLPSPYYTTPNSNFPLLHFGSLFHGTLFTPSASASTLPTPLPAHLDHHPGITLPRQLVSRFGGHYPYAPPRNQQVRLPSDVDGYNPITSFSATSSSSSFAAALPRLHSGHANPRSTPVAQLQFLRSTEASRNSDDYYLTALATQDFSSPSLPPLSSPPASTGLLPSDLPKRDEEGQDMPHPSTRRRRPSRGGAVDLTKEEPNFEAPNFGIDSSIPTVMMPSTNHRRRSGVVGATNPTASPAVRKRRSSAATSPSGRPNKSRRRDLQIDNLASPFDDDDPARLVGEDGSEHIDLSNATEVPLELMAPKVDNRVKIGKFQCVICMDDTTALTVTHCGHLFCSECLHSSLHIDSLKRTCPVCRSKVDLKDKKGKSVKSYYHLELKVMTAIKKGKRPVGS